MKVIVDTNVIIDALTGRKPWNIEAEQIFELAVLNSNIFFVTANVLTDIYYLMNKLIKDKEVVKECMEKLLDIFEIFDCCGNDCLNAFHSEVKDFEDAILAEIAKKNNVNYIISRNVRDFTESKVPVIEPKDFLCSVWKEEE